MINGEYRIIKI